MQASTATVLELRQVVVGCDGFGNKDTTFRVEIVVLQTAPANP